ncbi:unnamed protein product [Urochloa decumbens]|uniref:F-box domain-containing protein n=1 Tax=Urochloa decumbens TaxID=240449 RepID=A0ABC8WDP4_9POAL
MDDGVDRMSALSDDLLRRILYFVTSKEAASTSVLSRRWRLLWRSSGAVNLAVRLPGYQPHSTVKRPGTSIFSCQQAFDGAAEAALAAAEAPVTRLTVRLDGDTASINQFLHRDSDNDANVLDAILSHPKAAHVDYLRVALVGHTSDGGHFPDYLLESAGIYKLVSLPSSETLRVLDLTRCDLVPPSPAFPQLTTLRLRLCSFQLKDLQALLDAAPGLATVHLESIFFTLPPPPSGYSQYKWRFEQSRRLNDNTAAEPPVLDLRLPAVTTLVLASCGRVAEDRNRNSCWALEIDAPRLRSLVYEGQFRRFRLLSPAPDLARVDLHFLHHDDAHQRYGYYRNKEDDDDDTDKETTRVLFWQFLHNFASARALKLKVSNDLRDIAANGEARRAKLLRAFPSVERLELEGLHRPKSKTAAVAIANLLHCCPVLRDLTLRLSAVPPYSLNRTEYARPFLARKDRLDYSKSVDRFTRRSSETTNAIMEDSSSGVRCHDDVPDIPGLRGRSFACLQGSLRRVSLQFRLNESSSSCLGRRLVKFFAENAVDLEEMCVDSGNRRLYEHINFNVSTKACFEHRNLADGSCQFSRIIPNVPLDSSADHGRSTTGFTVSPLQRR